MADLTEYEANAMETLDTDSLHTSLTEPERSAFNEHERAIGKFLSSFIDAGEALGAISDGELHREHHKTFAEYCEKRWSFSRQRAHQLIVASKVAKFLSTIVDIPPTNENQVRPLVSLSDEVAKKAWKLAEKKADGKDLTGKLVKQAVDEIQGLVPKANNFDRQISGFVRGCEMIEKAAADVSPADWDDNQKERFSMAFKSALRIAVTAGILGDFNETSNTAADE